VEQWRPGKIQLDSIGDFYPREPIIYWKVTNGEMLGRMYKRLYTRLELPLKFRELIPHVTVAREISHHRVVLVKDQIASYLPEESFEVKAVDLVSPVADHHWVSVRTFPVAGA
jgi:2'-5' RNA ligase